MRIDTSPPFFREASYRAHRSCRVAVAFPALRSRELDAFEHQRKLTGVDLHVLVVSVGGPHEAKCPGLETFSDDTESVAVPEQDLRDVSTSIDEDEQVSTHRREPELRFDEGCEPIEALSGIDR